MAGINSFNAGELSPLLRYRPDFDKYSSGSAWLENFWVLPQGGIENRPGTEFIAFAKYPEKKVKLVRFEFNADQVEMLEFGDKYARVIGTETEVVTPYDHEKLRKLKFIQSGDVLYLVHPEYPPARLSRYANDDWRYEMIEFRYGPFMEENATETKVTASGVSGAITVTADGDIFEADVEGMLLEIIHPNMNTSLAHKFNDDNLTGGEGVSDTLEISDTWTLTTTGGWYGTLYLQRSFDNGTTWQDYRDFTSAQDQNFSSEGEEARENVLYRLKMTNWTASTESVEYGCSCTLSVQEYWVHGIVRIDGVTDARTVTGTVIEPIANTDATADWAFGAWNSRNGYPACVCFYQDRLCFANTSREPQTIWLSATGDYYNFKAGDDADMAMTYTIRTQQVNAISWMLPSKKGIIIGTVGGEGILAPVDEAEPLHPGNRQYSPETEYGSTDIPAVMVNDVILFIQRGREHVRELSYNWESEGYLSPDMSILAEHILRGGATEAAFRPLPFPVIYFVRADGELIGFTYERMQNVVAWHRHVTAGTFESVSTLKTEDGDQLWVAVRRNGKCCIERFFDRDFDGPADAAFLDCAKWAYDVQTVTGLDHLEGLTVEALADGGQVQNLTVTNGEVTLPDHAERVLVGLPYVSRCETMPLEMVGETGVTMGQSKRVTHVDLMYYRSLGGWVGLSTSNGLQAIDHRRTYHAMDSVPPLQSGQYRINRGSCYTKEESVIIEQRAPHPLTILAIKYNMGVYGK